MIKKPTFPPFVPDLFPPAAVETLSAVCGSVVQTYISASGVFTEFQAFVKER